MAATSGKMFGSRPVQKKVGVKYQPSPVASSNGMIKSQLKSATSGKQGDHLMPEGYDTGLQPSSELYDGQELRKFNQTQQLRQLPDTLQSLEHKKAAFLQKTSGLRSPRP